MWNKLTKYNLHLVHSFMVIMYCATWARYMKFGTEVIKILIYFVYSVFYFFAITNMILRNCEVVSGKFNVIEICVSENCVLLYFILATS
jgi:hypothetical protein